MSEVAPSNSEQLKPPELFSGEAENTKHESLSNNVKPEQILNADEIREKLLAEPEAPLELPVDDTPEAAQPQYVDRAMKRVFLKSELKQIRSKLNPTERLFSKLIHQPAIRSINQLSSKTISRPSGLLGGGTLAFCGSLAYLLFAKYAGIKYNYFVFLIFFAGGFILALIIELAARSLRRNKS